MAEKITKQELKQPDRFQVMSAQAMAYFLKYKKEVAIALGAVIVIVLAGTGWYFYNKNEENTAMSLYNKATEEFFMARVSGKDIAASQKKLEELEKKYSGTRAAAFAAYRLGNIALNQSDADGAMKWYQKYLSHDSSDNEFKVLVLNGMGYCYEIKKDYKNALSSFEKAANGKAAAGFAGMTYENIGRTYEALNDPKKAVENYKKALEKAVDPGMKELLNRKISSLG